MEDDVKALLGRAQKLLDKGCVRYADREFEVEREQLARDIEAFLLSLDAPEPGPPPEKPVVRLPVVK